MHLSEKNAERDLIENHAPDVRVDVELRRSEKADERLIHFPRKFHRKARRRGNGSNDRNSGRERFLDDFK